MDKVLQIAKNEVGYLEKNSNVNLDDKTKNAGSGNYTKYWRDLGASLQAQPWCAAFVSWCFEKAYGRTIAQKLLCAEKGYSYYTPTMANYFKSAKRFYTGNPRKGDIIFYKSNTRICHVGIVTNVDSQYVYTIEGNTSSENTVVANGGGVFEKKYALSNPRIAGYGRPDYALVDAPKVNPYKEPTKLLKKGSKGEGVKWLQYELNEVGYNLDIDGDFGKFTNDALIEFQKKVFVDGICGQTTRNELKKR